jgi:hypothetical protein
MIKAAVLLLPLLGLGACASQLGYFSGDLQAANEQLGQAVHQNIAVQTVNPQGSSEAVVASAARAASAVAAYTADDVQQPDSATTLSMKAAANTSGN